MGTVKIVKILLYTNVLVSALLFGGLLGRLRTLWKEKLVRPLVSQAIIDEYIRVLTYPKFQLSQDEIEYLLHQKILPWFETTGIHTLMPGAGEVRFPFCRVSCR